MSHDEKAGGAPQWLPVIIATGASLGVVIAYLIAGGASYEPLEAADPCQPRSAEVLADRGVFEGILLSSLDGAACELGVTREELTAALGDEAALEEFAAENDLTTERIEEAVRAGLVRAVDDAEVQGRLPAPVASIARGLAENAPIGSVIALFEALPGDPSVPEVIEALGEAGLTIQDVGEGAISQFDEFLDDLGNLDDVEGLIPDLNPDDLDGLLPEELDPSGVQEDLEGLLPEGVDPQDLEQFLP